MSSIKTRVSLSREYKLVYSEREKEAVDILNESDVIIVGHAPDMFIKRYIKTKLIIKSSERLFKDKTTPLLFFRRVGSLIKHHLVFQKYKPLYFGIGNNSLIDIKRTHLYKNRSYKWIYFPSIDYSFDNKCLENKIELFSNKHVNVVWAGRMVDCKRLEDLIMSTKTLIENDINHFHVKLIGDGDKRALLEELVKQNGLEKYISFIGLLPLDQTLEEIKKSDFLFMPSDKREGWGMVVNNAMNYGTVVIGNANSGAVSTLITNENGYIYNVEDIGIISKVFEDAIKSDVSERQFKARKAYNDLINLWSPEVAADRFYIIVKNALDGKYISPFSDGVFSQK